MQKETAIAVVATAVVVSVIDARLRTRAVKKAQDSTKEFWLKNTMDTWRRGFAEGFDDCNRRLHYPINRNDYPKFD